MLFFTSGPGTIVDPNHIEYMGKVDGVIENFQEIKISEDHRLFLQGEFGKFRIYYLVTHTRFEVIPESVKKVSPSHFFSRVKIQTNKEEIRDFGVLFRAPIVPFFDVRACSYGMFPDSFEFLLADSHTEKFPCDLSFYQYCMEDGPAIPLKVEYIGIAKSEKREAQDRLGKGHEKLQKMLAEQNKRQSRLTTSIVLYRPSELHPPVLPFSDVIETIEASMIQYFKPRPRNSERINFPHDSPALVNKLKSIDAKYIVTEVSSPAKTKLFSDEVEVKDYHKINIKVF